MMRKINYLFLLLLCLSGVVHADKDAPSPPNILSNSKTPTEAMPPVNNDQPIERIEPEVTIIRQAEKTIQEYRVNGQLTMVKVTPQVGPAYYLLDMDGDGVLETNRFALDENNHLNQWILFSW
ncbi:Protein of unknown function (DUF2782) [Beggiatoa alba B18LD]|uniref:DUF2782 domain-containing protein n=1 Tax=Beggiatoa alba B18LD TaxID=395493 RepID=I3CFP2_9GAMM|nr:DUF2782 domain-containing protein [Beggiatoa alba]EIJ42435.1 Protein of unknown function (DUF2782) [Beggiatoa alba B18LD]